MVEMSDRAVRSINTKLLRITVSAASLLFLTYCGYITSNATYRCTVGSTWQTLVDYSAGASVNTIGYGVWSDSTGNIFTSATTGNGTPDTWLIRKLSVDTGAWTQFDSYVKDASADHDPGLGLAATNGYHYTAAYIFGGPSDIWLVRRSTDNGQTWTNVDSYTGSDIATSTGVWPESIYEDPATGRIFVGGTVYMPAAHYGVIRMSADRGTTWSRVEQFQYASGQPSYVISNFAKDSSGALYWGGCGTNSGGTLSYGIIRKSIDQGSTWSTYATIAPSGTNTAVCIYGLHITSNGTVYATGHYTDSGAIKHAAAYKSTDGGLSFSQVDDFQYASGKSTEPDIFSHTFAADNSDGLYYIVKATDSSNKIRSVVRRSVDGTNWSTSDDFVLASGQNSTGTSITKDARGNILTHGGYKDSSGVNHAIVRKLSCNP